MKAKELLTEAFWSKGNIIHDEIYGLPEDCFVFSRQDMNEFINEMCKEQREMCRNEVVKWTEGDTHGGMIDQQVLNAKQPEL